MRDRHNLNEKGIGRSLGYAFVTFSDHQNALTTLRSLNNNPDVFGPLKRPIVEFVLENKYVKLLCVLLHYHARDFHCHTRQYADDICDYHFIGELWKQSSSDRSNTKPR